MTRTTFRHGVRSGPPLRVTNYSFGSRIALDSLDVDGLP
jgi:hypothetical protein